MYNLEINPNWTFQETVEHLETLKSQYEEILASFSYFQLKQSVEFAKNTRSKFYSLSFEEWKKDKIWNYMNGFEFLYVLKGIVSRLK